MKKPTLKDLFIDELKDMYNSEHQIVKSLPDLIAAATAEDLKEALTKHLKETQNQVKRLEKVFSLLSLKPAEITCEAMEGLIKEANELVEDHKGSPSTLDAAIISAAQKVEHYEIASYGTLRSFAKQLDFDSEIIDLLTENLDEEGAADKKLTKIAEGTIFSSGVNKESAEPVGAHKSKK